MKCKSCDKIFNIDELCDDECYNCSNNDKDYILDLTSAIKELIENTLQTIANAKDITLKQLKTELVIEHAYNHPEKYAKELIQHQPAKKIPDEEPN